PSGTGPDPPAATPDEPTRPPSSPQPTDPMNPPPPPASARFPDNPPTTGPADRDAEGARSGTATDAGFFDRRGMRPPASGGPGPQDIAVGGPAASGTGFPGRTGGGPAASGEARSAGPDGARSSAARPVARDDDRTTRPGTSDSARPGTSGSARPGTSGSARPGVPGSAAQTPHSTDSGGPRPSSRIFRLDGARPADSNNARVLGEGATSAVPRPAGPDGSGPVDANRARPARSDAPRPAATDTSRFLGVDTSRATGADTPRPARPDVPRPATPPESIRPSGLGSRSPGSVRPSGLGSTPPESVPPAGVGLGAEQDGVAWSPLPRAWAPAPSGSPREGLSSAVPGRRTDSPVPQDTEREAGPAWTPGTSARHPEFDVPPAPSAPPPEAPRGPDPALSWSAPMAPGGAGGATRPVVTFAEPEGYGDRARRGRIVAAAACVVLGLGLIGGAVTGSWLIGDSAEAGEAGSYAAAGGLWHNVPVDQLFPPTVDGQGAGPGGADRTWTRIAVAPDTGCAGAFDPLLLKALAPVGCARLLRATYTDATQSYVTTVGLLFTTADADGMRALDTRFDKEGLARRTDLMPRPYAARGTVAAAFGDRQRASWTISVLTDAPVVVYAVSGWADGRRVATPQPAAEATASGATTAPAQAGLGNEAKGLADRIERSLRRTAASPSEQPS
ncbi:hypothetical protein, partial [Streptomyces sp. A012304]|uniref:hypothetical protein n=1 Tax=Streptomyces sp. A012304 TaxID=375446 RepID=UPI00222EDF2E